LCKISIEMNWYVQFIKNIINMNRK
jgi:hypothetical protein